MKKLLLSLETTGDELLEVLTDVDTEDLVKECCLIGLSLLAIDEKDTKEILKKTSIEQLNSSFEIFFTKNGEDYNYQYQDLLTDFFKEEFNLNITGICYPGDYETISSQKGMIYFDYYNNQFIMAEDYLNFEETYYNHWHGSNIKKYLVYAAVELSLSEDSLNLDTWDGNNHCLPSQKFGHGSIYKILKYVDMDSKKEDESYKDMYLYEEWTQYQGTFIAAELLSETGVINKITSLYEDTPFEDEISEKIKEFETLFL